MNAKSYASLRSSAHVLIIVAMIAIVSGAVVSVAGIVLLLMSIPTGDVLNQALRPPMPIWMGLACLFYGAQLMIIGTALRLAALTSMAVGDMAESSTKTS